MPIRPASTWRSPQSTTDQMAPYCLRIMSSTNQISSALLYLFSAFGLWSLVVQLFTHLSLSAQPLRYISAVILTSGLLAALLQLRHAPKFEHNPHEQQVEPAESIQFKFAWLVPLTASTIYLISKNEWITWGITSAFCACIISRSVSKRESPNKLLPEPIATREALAVLTLLSIAMVITLGSDRADMDDGHFLSLAQSAFEHPNAPPYGYDNIYHDNMPLLEQHLHMVETYPYLIATTAQHTGLSVHLLYYKIAPAFSATLSILASWLLLRNFLTRHSAVLGTCILIFLLLAWGDGHRTFGNFAFTRLYQSKSTFLTLGIPILLLGTQRFASNPNIQNWLILSFIQTGAIGLTTNALIIAPIVTGLSLLAMAITRQCPPKHFFIGSSASIPTITMGFTMIMHLKATYGLNALEVDPILTGYETVWGDNRAPLAILGLTSLPIILRSAGIKSNWLYILCCISTILLLFPLSDTLAAYLLSPVFSWRIFWILPLPLLLAGGLAHAVTLDWPHRATAAIFLATFAGLGPWAINSSNWSWSNINKYPTFPEYHTASSIHASGLTLAPEKISLYLACQPNPPPLVINRRLYLEKLQSIIPEDDYQNRIQLLNYLENRSDAQLNVKSFISLAQAHKIRTIIISAYHPDLPALIDLLPREGYQVSQLTADYVIAEMIHNGS